MWIYQLDVDKMKDLLTHLTDLEILFTLCSILPMLDQMHTLMKYSQKISIYIFGFISLIKFVCIRLDSFYLSNDESFKGPEFESSSIIIDIKNPQNILKFDLFDNLCMPICEIEIKLKVYNFKTNILGGDIQEVPMSRLLFENYISSTRLKLCKIAQALRSEICEYFKRDELLEAMVVVNPTFWYTPLGKRENSIKSMYQKNKVTLVKHFYKTY